MIFNISEASLAAAVKCDIQRNVDVTNSLCDVFFFKKHVFVLYIQGQIFGTKWQLNCNRVAYLKTFHVFLQNNNVFGVFMYS